MGVKPPTSPPPLFSRLLSRYIACDCSDAFVIFSGGMPRASYGDRHTVSVIRGDTHVVFDLTSPVVDFVVLCSADEQSSTDVAGVSLTFTSE